jgi:hypothetical protein
MNWRDGLPIAPSRLLRSLLGLDTRVSMDTAGLGELPWQNSISGLTLLAIHDKVFPRMRVSNANGSLQTAPEPGRSKLLGEEKADRKNSQ